MDPESKIESFVNVQKIKGLISGWQSMSMALRKEEKHEPADVIDRCIDELSILLL